MAQQNNLRKFPRNGLTAKRQVDAWLGFLWTVVLDFWWVIIAVTLLGGVIGFLQSRSTTNRYEARAAFLMPLEDSQAEYERLFSRSLVAAIAPQFAVSSWIDKGGRGLYEMYDESPFTIRPMSIPPEIMDVHHELRLLPGNKFQMDLRTPSRTLAMQGNLGEPTRLGGIILQVNANQLPPDWVYERKYWVTFNSEAAVVNRFLSNLVVIHHAEHPNRIGLQYTESHPQLALDMLGAFTTAYLEAFLRQKHNLFTELRRGIDAELRVLEAQILSQPDSDPITIALAEKGKQLIQSDSSAIRLLDVRIALQSVEDRIARLEEYKAGRIHLSQLPASIQQQASTLDSPTKVGDLSQSPALQSAPLDSLLEADRALAASLRAKTLLFDADFLSTTELDQAIARNWISHQQDGFTTPRLLREKYIDALQRSAKIDLEIRKDLRSPQLIDPPYLAGMFGRSLRLKTLVAAILFSLLLGLCLALVLSLNRKRFRSVAHFLIKSQEAATPVLRWPLSPVAERQQWVEMELGFAQGQKVAALIGSSADLTTIGQAWVGAMAGFGHTIGVISGNNISLPQGVTGIVLPEGAALGWWFSANALKLLEAQRQQFDRILIFLPPAHESPEMAAALKHADQCYCIAHKNQTTIKNWRAWQALSEKIDHEYDVIWVE